MNIVELGVATAPFQEDQPVLANGSELKTTTFTHGDERLFITEGVGNQNEVIARVERVSDQAHQTISRSLLFAHARRFLQEQSNGGGRIVHLTVTANNPATMEWLQFEGSNIFGSWDEVMESSELRPMKAIKHFFPQQ